jgi:carboxylesterase type B
LGLYSRPWTDNQPLRPVVVVYYGGGFIEGGGSFSIPPAGYPVLNVSSANDFIFVYPNYRVNAFGLLPGAEIAASPTSDLNPGLLDQQAALQWTNKYIEKFGGDPKNVSIWGQSAGGGSVVAQVIANGGKTDPPLFSKALVSSPYWPKTYNYDAPEAQSVYDTFANLSGCSGPESLKCLKNADVQTLRTAALAISGSHTYNTSSYTWAPVIDEKFLTQPLSQATIKGEVNIDFGFGMYNTHEGKFLHPFHYLLVILNERQEKTSSHRAYKTPKTAAHHPSTPASPPSTPGSEVSSPPSQIATSCEFYPSTRIPVHQKEYQATTQHTREQDLFTEILS